MFSLCAAANGRINIILHHDNNDAISIAVHFDCEGVLSTTGSGPLGRDNSFLPRPNPKTSLAVDGGRCGRVKIPSPDCEARRSEGPDDEAGLVAVPRNRASYPHQSSSLAELVPEQAPGD